MLSLMRGSGACGGRGTQRKIHVATVAGAGFEAMAAPRERKFYLVRVHVRAPSPSPSPSPPATAKLIKSAVSDGGDDQGAEEAFMGQ